MNYLIFLLLFSFEVFGIQTSVVSHYPESAFVSNRLLPFSVQGSNVASVIKVIAQGNESCSTLIDPYYSHIFHLYCREEGIVSLTVTLSSADPFDSVISLRNIKIRQEASPGEDAGDPFSDVEERF